MLPNLSLRARLRPIKWRMKHSSIWHKALFWSFLIVSDFTKRPSMELRKGRSTEKMFHFRYWLIMCCMRGAKKVFIAFIWHAFISSMALSPQPAPANHQGENENHLMSANSHTFSARIPSAIIMSSWITHYLSILITHFLFSSWQRGPGTGCMR